MALAAEVLLEHRGKGVEQVRQRAPLLHRRGRSEVASLRMVESGRKDSLPLVHPCYSNLQAVRECLPCFRTPSKTMPLIVIMQLTERALMSSTVILRLRCFLAAGLAAVPGAGAAALPPHTQRHTSEPVACHCAAWCKCMVPTFT